MHNTNNQFPVKDVKKNTARKMEVPVFGNFNWKGTPLSISSKSITYKGTKTNIRWINAFTLFHKGWDGKHYWYYTWNATTSMYHCFKYLANYGFYEMSRMKTPPMKISSTTDTKSQIEYRGSFDWKGSLLVVGESTIQFNQTTTTTTRINYMTFYYTWGPALWYCIWDHKKKLYHCIKYKLGSGDYYEASPLKKGTLTRRSFTPDDIESKKSALGRFNWKDALLIITAKHVEFNGKKTAITWLNALAFYHKQGTNYWYYAFDEKKSVYQCFKYDAGYGFYEMSRMKTTVSLPEIDITPETKIQYQGTFDWKGSLLVVGESSIQYKNNTRPTSGINGMSFYYGVGSSFWYCIWDHKKKLYHCVEYKLGPDDFYEAWPLKKGALTRQSFTPDDIESKKSVLGRFNWKGTPLIVTTKHIEFNGKKTAITWLNALAFYHKQGTGYWYYAFDDQKSVYHCVKWFTGDGFYEMARKSMT